MPCVRPAWRHCFAVDAGHVPALAHRLSLVARLRNDGTWEAINHHLVMRDRKRTRREARKHPRL